MYVSGRDKPIMITSDRRYFDDQIKLAKDGKISKREKKGE